MWDSSKKLALGTSYDLCHNTRTRTPQVNNILQARNDELEKTMAEKGVGFLAEAATQEGAVQTAR